MVLHGFTWCYAVLYGVTRRYVVLDVLHLFLLKPDSYARILIYRLWAIKNG